LVVQTQENHIRPNTIPATNNQAPQNSHNILIFLNQTP